MSKRTFNLYLLFLASYFLRLPTRLPFLATLRFDLVLITTITALLVFTPREPVRDQRGGSPAEALMVLIGYVVITLPFVEWPGSVLFNNLPVFLKGIIFYFFTVALVRDEHRLRSFIVVFVSCQAFRVLEPLYLHFTQGYWGSVTHMGEGSFMSRLAGSPYDMINPNGLAFVVLTILPFLHYQCLFSSRTANLAAYALVGPFSLYALKLTASRSGFLGLLMLMAAIVYGSRHKFVLLGTASLLLLLGLASLSDIERDRYLSIFRDDVRGAGTARGRIEGVKADFLLALERPIVGHGLGTSAEANYHGRGRAQLSHNLYTEVLEELGLVGLAIFLTFIKRILGNFRRAFRQIRHAEPSSYLTRLTQALMVWFWMNLLFSFASYGLSSYEWYLFGGLSVVVSRLAQRPAVHALNEATAS